MKRLLLSLYLITSLSSLANEVAKVIILKGNVAAYVENSEKPRKLKRGDWVSEGEIVKCAGKSFAKLLFIDKSQINISPNSEMVIKEFPRKKAGIINLIKGKVRAKVTKNYMDINPSGSKLFIKTRTAAMGVRGTDFQVIFNPKNDVTSLLTFEGAVAMAKLNGNIPNDQRNLDNLLNNREAVLVRAGQFSGSMPSRGRVSLPVKISPTQLESLKNSDDQVSSGKTKKVEKKSKVVRSIVPKGLDPKKVAEVGQEIVKKTIGVNSSTEVKTDRGNRPPAEGFSNKRTGEFAPPAGGYVDQKTGLYVPPVEGSTYDANAEVYIPPPEVGSVDVETGEYVPPEGYKLTDSGELTKEVDTSRGPASVGTTNESKINVITAAETGVSGGAEAADGPSGDTQKRLINNFQQETLQDFNNPTEKKVRTGNPNVKIRLRR